MKKIFIAFVIVFAIPNISFASIDINLKYGSQGIDVSELQDFLIANGFLAGQATGNFFFLTSKAVIDYQTSVSLPATGFVGPMTREKINNELSQWNTPAISAEISETGMGATTSIKTIFTKGCLVGYKFSTETGHPCPQQRPMAPGCQVGYAFSSTTGQSCLITSTSTTTTATTTPLAQEKREETHATTTPSGTIPAVPATPSSGGGSGGGNTPAVPATPAQPQDTPASTQDTTAPIISNISAITTETTATITWTTNELSDSRVYFLPVTSTSTPVGTNSTLVLNHSVVLNGLSSSVAYSYVVGSRDVSGNTSASSEYSFLTSAAASNSISTGTPINLSAVNQNSFRIDLGWSASSSTVAVVSYDIYRARDLAGSYSKIATVIAHQNSNTYSFSDVNVVQGYTYSYKVKAYNGQEYSPLSNSVNATANFTTVLCISESDGGLDYSHAGYVTTAGGTYYDSVLDQSILGQGVNLREAYCDGDSRTPASGRNFHIADVSCAEGSSGGACPAAVAPVITNIQATNITQNSATITWNTATPSGVPETAPGVLTIKTEPFNVSSTGIDFPETGSGTWINHSIAIGELTPVTTYYLKIVATGGSGLSSTAYYSFSTI